MIPTAEGKIEMSKDDLVRLKNYLNDNPQFTTFSDGSGEVLHIISLHEVILKGKLSHYGIMGKFKDFTETHNRQGDFYGEGYKQWEYPGSINIAKEGINIFLRNNKIERIIKKI